MIIVLVEVVKIINSVVVTHFHMFIIFILKLIFMLIFVFFNNEKNVKKNINHYKD